LPTHNGQKRCERIFDIIHRAKQSGYATFAHITIATLILENVRHEGQGRILRFCHELMRPNQPLNDNGVFFMVSMKKEDGRTWRARMPRAYLNSEAKRLLRAEEFEETVGRWDGRKVFADPITFPPLTPNCALLMNELRDLVGQKEINLAQELLVFQNSTPYRPVASISRSQRVSVPSLAADVYT